MSQVLNFKVVNAQLVPLVRSIDVDGQPATVNFTRAVIEAQPEDSVGKTLTAILPEEALEEFPEGTSITVTIEVAQLKSEA